MIIPKQTLARRADLIDWSDITTSRCVTVPYMNTDGETMTIPFEPDITDPEIQQRVLIRLLTPDSTQESQHVRARQALTELKKIREGTSTLTTEQRWRLVARVLVVLIIRQFRLKDAE